MNKKTKFSLFLFFSVLSVLIALAIYYQVDRYLWLSSVKQSNIKVEKYKELPKADDNSIFILYLFYIYSIFILYLFIT